MRQVSTFSVRGLTSVEVEGRLIRAELLKFDSPTSLMVEGSTLEAQYETSKGFLLMLTEDCPYEEALHIYLVDHGNSILDEIHMGQAYVSGILGDLDPIAPDQLQFSFFGNDLWKLRILESPRRMPPRLNAPQVETRWSRIFSKRFLELTRMKP
jgi:hypothetical protein